MGAAPRLSIGLPVYNGEKLLEEALHALLGQTYEDFELILSDNASIDGTADICRRYEKQDHRIRYIRQPRNIGAAPNHNFVFQQSRGELFKWAAADDLYSRDLLKRCVDALDEYPDIVLAHSWTAAVDGTGNVTQALKYPLATDSPRAPDRFRSMLFGSSVEDAEGVVRAEDYDAELVCEVDEVIRADDLYGVIRADVMRRVPPHNSYHHADRIFMAEIALHGPFYQAPDWLYFRRDHTDRALRACPTMRTWCANLDPRRASRLRNPSARLVAEYIWGYVAAIWRAPLTPTDRAECYGLLAQWAAQRVSAKTGRVLRGGVPQPKERVFVSRPVISVDAVVAGRGPRSS